MQLVHQSHPLQTDFKDHGRYFKEGATIADILELNKIDLIKEASLLRLNNTRIDPEDWNKIVVKNDDIISIRGVVHGDQGSQLAVMIASIAILAVAPGVGMAFTFAQQGLWLQAGFIMLANITAIGAVMLLNQLVAPPEPDLSQPKIETASPTYSLTEAGNRARPYGRTPVIFGRHKIFPDTDALPFYELGDDGDFFLNQSFNFGKSDIVISDLQIGDQAIGDYNDVEYELSGGDGIIDLFPTNTTQNSLAITLSSTDGFFTETGTTNAVQIAITLAFTLFAIDDKDGSTKSNSVQLTAEYKEVGDLLWTPFFDNGTVSRKTITHAKKGTIRRQYKVTGLSPGQYQVRIRKDSYDQDDNQYRYNTVNWIALTNYERDTTDYTDQNRLAIRAKATDRLQGALDQVNAIASARTEAWNGSAWVTTETSNPAWWYRHVLKGLADGTGRIYFGAGLSDDRIDEDGIIAWGEWCDDDSTRGYKLEFNYVLDETRSIGEMLNIIARAGRAKPDWSAGLWGVVYDAEDTTPAQVFNQNNTIADTFIIRYTSIDTSDEVVVNYIDDTTWKPDRVRVTVPTVATPSKVADFSIPGITNQDQAGGEANLIAASQIYHRREFVFEVDAEALLTRKGSVIGIGNTLLDQESGRLLGGNTTSLTLDHDVDLDSFTDPHIQVRAPDGTIETKDITSSGTTSSISISGSFSFDVDADAQSEPVDYIWTIGSSSTPYTLAKIQSIESLDDTASRFRITAREESSDYYSAETGSFNYDAPGFFNRSLVSVTDISVDEDWLDEAGVRVNVSYLLVQATAVQIRTKLSTSDAYDDQGVTTGSEFSVVVPHPLPANITFEFTPIGIQGAKVQSAKTLFVHDIVGFLNVPDNAKAVPDVKGLQLTNGVNQSEFQTLNANFRWRAAGLNTEFGDQQQLELGDSWGKVVSYEVRVVVDGVVVRRDNVFITEWQYTWQMNYDDNDGDVAREFTILVYAVGRFGQLSNRPARITVSNPAPDEPTLSVTAGLGQYFVRITPPTNTPDLKGYRIFEGSSTGFTPLDSNEVYDGPNTFQAVDAGEGTTVYVKAAAYDEFSKDVDDLNFSAEHNVTILSQEIPSPYQTQEILFQQNDPSTNQISWTAGTIFNTEGDSYSISGSNATYTGSPLYIYWVEGDTALSTTTSLSTAINNGVVQFGTYYGGATFIGANGDAYVDGNTLVAGTVAGNKMIANTITASQIATGTITANEMSANSIGTDELQANSITAAKGQIANLAVVNSKIANLAVSQGKIANLAVSNGKIQNLAVSAGKIQNAAVQTLKIGADQVTVPAAAFTSSQAILTTSWTTYQSVSGTFDASGVGAKVHLVSTFTLLTTTGGSTTSISFRLVRDSTVVYNAVIQVTRNSSSLQWAQIPLSASDTPGSGGHTYYLQVKESLPGFGDNYSRILNRSLLALGAQR